MFTIGLRAAPRSVTFAIYNSENETVVCVEAIKIPVALSVPDRLKYLRNNLLDVLREYGAVKAGVRITESNARKVNIERVQIEGVIQEAFASSNLTAYYVGQIASISTRLDIDRQEFKPLVEGEEDYGIENWGEMSREQREALLCAVGAVDA